jgi:hypothetical protein
LQSINHHKIKPEMVMKRFMKVVLPIIVSLILAASLSRPAHAQFAGEGGFEQIEQFAPMLEMMKKKMGKKCFAQVLQTMGPFISQMVQSGGGVTGFGAFGGSGFDMSAMSGMMNAQSMAAITQMFDSKGPCHRRGRLMR